MKNLSKLLLASALLGALSAPAFAQAVNQVPQIGVINDVQKRFTYAATSIGLVPASAATDIFCIAASTNRTVSVKEITLSGTAGTAITTPVLLYRRATVDTGGTAATSTALPVAGTLSSSDPASTAVLVAYTANPTVTDSAPVLLAGPAVSFSVTTGTNAATFLYAGTNVDFFAKGFDLIKGSTQQLCLNLNGATIATGVLALSIKWEES